MSANEFLCAPYPFTVLDIGTAGSNGANLGTERLGRTAYMGNGYAALDLGYPRPVDTAALLATNAPSVPWNVIGYNSLSDLQHDTNRIGVMGGLTWASSEASKRLHRQGMVTTDVSYPITARYWVIGCGAPFNVGRFVIGQRYQASDTRDVGWSFKVIDLGDYKQSATKLDNSLTRGKTLEFSWTWSWLSEAEARGALLDLAAYAGITRDVLLCLDPAATDLHNMIAYGKIVEMPELTNVSGGSPDIANAFKVDLRLQSRLLLNL